VPLFTKQYKLVPELAGCEIGTPRDTLVCGLAASAGVWLRATETEISAALWALMAWEGL